MTGTELLEAFGELHRNTPKITEVRETGSEEDRAWRKKEGLPVSLCNMTRHMNWMPHYDSMYSFWQENQTFWLIPCDLPDGTVPGYVMRGLKKSEYRVVVPNDKLQLCSGWWSFGDYEKGKPIILTEGIKDVLYLKQHYSHSLALLTARASKQLLRVLLSMTKEFVVALDNDDTGREQFADMKDRIKRAGGNVRRLEPELKDWGTYFMRPDLENKVRIQIQKIL